MENRVTILFATAAAVLLQSVIPTYGADIKLPEKIEKSKQITFCTDVGFPHGKC
ncbi:hypothetical protein [Sinorhizobium psoraleae]|uniref:Uncharacterized protein n=1 Tax=Sinorhizobium psoraleae TaxID=520838 RepID=A0ABT4K9K0_9HYPH|nr:hypothetical protein [Sinorhizobium psoraleae]MCZ4088624.1 hypothetical protein [Sinorhizobium psoraleae]